MKYKMMKFLSPDDGGGDGGDGEGASKGADAFKDGVAPAKVVDEPAKVDEPKAPVNVIDAAQFAEAIKGAFPVKEPEDKPLTEEEAKKMLKVWEPDDAFLKEFGNLETQKAAFIKFRDGLLAQFDTLAQFRLRDLETAMTGKFNPALEYVTKAEVRERDADFAKAYPDIAKPELKPLIEAVRDQFKKDRKTFASEDEHHKAVAMGVEAVIKTYQPDFKLSAGSTPAITDKSKSQPANAIPAHTLGSGGGGGGKGDGPAKSRGAAVFEK